MTNSQKCYGDDSVCKNFEDSDYVKISRAPSVAIEENGKKIIFINKNKECLAHIKVDGGLINTSDEKKVDDILIRCNFNILYIIELKGGHVDRAYQQVLNTMRLIKEKISGAIINVRIIVSRTKTPDLCTSAKRKIQDLCRKNNGNMIIKTRKHEEHL